MDDAPSPRSSSDLDDRKSPDGRHHQVISELKGKFARLLEATIESSHLSLEEMAKKVDHKLEQMFDNLARKPEVCRICLEPVPADTRYGLLEACSHAHCEPCLRGWIAESRRQVPYSKTVSCPTCRAKSTRVLFNDSYLKCGEFEDDCQKVDKLNAVLYVEHVWIEPESNSDLSIVTRASTPRGRWAQADPTIENDVDSDASGRTRRESISSSVISLFTPRSDPELAASTGAQRSSRPIRRTSVFFRNPAVSSPADPNTQVMASEVEDGGWVARTTPDGQRYLDYFSSSAESISSLDSILSEAQQGEEEAQED